jgi:hypothetical protein
MPVGNFTPAATRVAPCGAQLNTSGPRVRGIALHRKVARQLRQELDPWGIPLVDSDVHVQPVGAGVIAGAFAAITDERLAVTFTHRRTAAELVVSDIWVDDAGQILQLGSNYGALTL